MDAKPFAADEGWEELNEFEAVWDEWEKAGEFGVQKEDAGGGEWDGVGGDEGA